MTAGWGFCGTTRQPVPWLSFGAFMAICPGFTERLHRAFKCSTTELMFCDFAAADLAAVRGDALDGTHRLYSFRLLYVRRSVLSFEFVFR